MIVQISMNTTAMGKKDILNSQIKTEVKSFLSDDFYHVQTDAYFIYNHQCRLFELYSQLAQY